MSGLRDPRVGAAPDAPPARRLLRYGEHPRDRRCRVVDPEVRVNDPPLRSEHRHRAAETAAAQLRQGVTDVRVTSTVVYPDTRSVRGDAAPPK